MNLLLVPLRKLKIKSMDGTTWNLHVWFKFSGQFNENYYNFFKHCQGLNNYDTHGPTLPCTLINPCPEECQFDMSE